MSVTRQAGKVLALGAFCFFLSGCASIMHGGSEDIGISSNPSNAQVKIDGKKMGATPLTTKLDRGDSHTVTIERPGYETYSATFTKHVSGWVWGNLLFGGLIGLAVDAGTGGFYYLTPDDVSAQLIPLRRTSQL